MDVISYLRRLVCDYAKSVIAGTPVLRVGNKQITDVVHITQYLCLIECVARCCAENTTQNIRGFYYEHKVLFTSQH